MRKIAHALALLAAGAAAYYTAPVAIRLMRPAAAPVPAPIATVLPTPGTGAGPIDQAGDVVLLNSLAALERRRSVEAEVVQAGYVLDQPLEITGVYRQQGRAAERRFATLLQGRVADTPLRLWQVSNGVHLYTDFAWRHGQPDARRDVTQIDLREVRRAVAPRQADDWANVGRGQAAAATLDPALSAAFGGLPMLLESLAANFHFGTPRKMNLHNQPVFVMVGDWREASLAALTGSESGDPDPQALARLPNHVLLVLGASDLFPYLIEYRSPRDPLSSPDQTVDTRLQQSGRPMLRLEFRRPRFDLNIADTQFQYPEAATISRRDITGARLETLRGRQRLRVAARQAARR